VPAPAPTPSRAPPPRRSARPAVPFCSGSAPSNPCRDRGRPPCSRSPRRRSPGPGAWAAPRVAVGLHLSGNDGLFITLPGIRKLPNHATIDTVRTLTPIDLARDDMHRQPGPGEVIDLGDWVRPVLLDGLAVLLLEPPRQQDS